MSELALVASPIGRTEGSDPFQELKQFVLASVPSPNSQRAYARALDEFFAWWQIEALGRPFSRTMVQEHRAALLRRGFSPSSINLRLSAIRKLASEACDEGRLDRDIAESIRRVAGIQQRGVRTGHWLTQEEAKRLLLSPDSRRLKGLRDRAILAVLMGCALRREEIARLEFRHVAMREARWVIVDLVGKGRRVRSVPVPAWVKLFLDRWTAAAQITEGRLFRAVNKAGKIAGESLSDDAVWLVVREYATALGRKQWGPHDLRRTCAKLCRASGGALEQIQLLLGHASIATTERYLGTQQNLVEAVNDHLGILGAEEAAP